MKKLILFVFGIYVFHFSFSQNENSIINESIHVKIKDLKVGDTIPEWGVIPLNKREWLPLKDIYKQNLVLIEFWFTQCRYCIESIPKLNDLYLKYNDKGLKIVYANALLQEGSKEIQEFKDKHHILFDVYRFGNLFDGSLPTFLLIGKNGIIKYKSDGYPDDLTGDIEKLIK